MNAVALTYRHFTTQPTRLHSCTLICQTQKFNSCTHPARPLTPHPHLYALRRAAGSVHQCAGHPPCPFTPEAGSQPSAASVIRRYPSINHKALANSIDHEEREQPLSIMCLNGLEDIKDIKTSHRTFASFIWAVPRDKDAHAPRRLQQEL